MSAPGANFGLFCPMEAQSARKAKSRLTANQTTNYKENLEARVGIEPTHKGFADPALVQLTSFSFSIKCEERHRFVRFLSAPTGNRYLKDKYDEAGKLRKYWGYLANNVVLIRISHRSQWRLDDFRTINECGVRLNPMDFTEESSIHPMFGWQNSHSSRMSGRRSPRRWRRPRKSRCASCGIF